MSREELERRKQQAVRFARDVREDDDPADEIEDQSLEDYAEHRRIRLSKAPRPALRDAERLRLSVPSKEEAKDLAHSTAG